MSENLWQDIDYSLCGGATFADEDTFYGMFKKMRQENPVHRFIKLRIFLGVRQ